MRTTTTEQLFGLDEEELIHIHFCLHFGADEVTVGGTTYKVEKVDSINASQLFNRIHNVGPFTFITQNMRKQTWNTQAVKRHAANGNTLRLTWVSRGTGPFRGQISSMTLKKSPTTQWEILDYEQELRRTGEMQTPKREEMIVEPTVAELMQRDHLMLVAEGASHPKVQHLVSNPQTKVPPRQSDRRGFARATMLCTTRDGRLIPSSKKTLPTCKKCTQAAGLAKAKEGEKWRDTTQRSA